MATIQDYISSCQRRFNRRDYEQFILPIIKLFELQLNNINKQPLNRITLTTYVNNVMARVTNKKEKLINEEEVINIQELNSILEEEKSLII
jgi:acetolactate synthase small subunit